MSARRGVSLAELMVVLVIAGIIGVALTRLVISQARFVSNQDAMLQSRSGVRASLTIMTSELRSLTPGGLVAAGTDSIVVQVPYAFGVSCFYFTPFTIMSLLPGDSSIYKGARASGYAWRDSTATWRFQAVAAGSVGTFNPTGLCGASFFTSPTITTLSTGTWTPTGISVPGTVAPSGSLVYLYQRITYVFAPSASLPGRKALWRRVAPTGANDELVVPFDTGSGFSFLVGSRLAVRTAPPAVLDSIVGVRVRLVGQSELTPEGKSAPSRFDVSTNILFRNNAGY